MAVDCQLVGRANPHKILMLLAVFDLARGVPVWQKPDSPWFGIEVTCESRPGFKAAGLCIAGRIGG